MKIDDLPPFALSQVLAHLYMEDVCRGLASASKSMLAAICASITQANVDCAGKRKHVAGPGILHMLKRYSI